MQWMKFWKEAKLRHKFRLIIIPCLFIAIITVSTLNIYINESAMVSNSMKQQKSLIAQISINLNTKLSEVSITQFNVFSLLNLNEILDDRSHNEITDVEFHQRINDYFYSMFFAKQDMNALYISDNRGRYDSLAKDNKDYSYLLDMLVEQKQEIDEAAGAPIWMLGTDNQILMGRKIIDVSSLQGLGQLALSFDRNYFTDLYQDVDSSGYSTTFLVDVSHRAIDTETTEYIDIVYSRWDRLLNRSSLQEQLTWYGRDYVLTAQKVGTSNLVLVNLLDVQQMTQYENQLRVLVLLLAVIMMLVFSTTSDHMVRGITDKISILVQKSQDMQRGEFHTPVPDLGEDEVGVLGRELNRMSDEIGTLINEVYEGELRKMDLEMRAVEFEYSQLQAKMNPHFLYNTLESINSIAKINHQTDISRMIYLLGNLLRESINNQKKMIPVAEELEYVKRYLEIQTYTFGDRFEVIYDIDDGVLTHEIPKFIVQPIVENAFIHGIEELSTQGLIEISCYEENDLLIFTIYDNGQSADVAMIRSLLARDEDTKKVGIHAVDKRIKLLYGVEFGISLDENVKNGTKFIITLPTNEDDTYEV